MDRQDEFGRRWSVKQAALALAKMFIGGLGMTISAMGLGLIPNSPIGFGTIIDVALISAGVALAGAAITGVLACLVALWWIWRCSHQADLREVDRR